jgi:hypothetical protein
MSNAMCSWFKWSILGVTLLLGAAIFRRPVQGQWVPSIRVGSVEIAGIPQDWSDHYVVFSNPGTEQEAIQSGRYEQWLRIVNEPRYVMHQLKRNAPVQGPAATDVEFRSRWISEATGPRTPLGAPEQSGPPEGFAAHLSRPIRRDWSQSLGGPGLALGHSPAKFSLMVNNTASCNDYVAFPTGAAGASNQASILAFNNLYAFCSGTVPAVFWAYNTGGGAIANTSPVLSLDGTQVAFIQTNGGVASLVILKMANSGGTVGSPVTVTSVPTSNYRTCSPAPCMTTLSLGANDTNSAPFYRYDGSDTLYVGDDIGRLHTFTGVFNATPAEPATAIPVQPTGGSPAPKLTSPVYDFGGSNLVFVSGNWSPTGGCTAGSSNNITVTTCGRLYSVNPASRAVTNSSSLDCGTMGFQDPPIVDSTTENVYAFIGSGCDTITTSNTTAVGNSYINRFIAGPGLSTQNGGFGPNAVSFLNGSNNANTNTRNTIGRHGAFDNMYFLSPNTCATNPSTCLGNAYACVNGRIYQLPMSSLNGTGSTERTFSTPLGGPNDTLPCSPLTEFLRGGTQDLLFLSIRQGGGNSVVLDYDITTGTIPPPNPAQLTVGPGTGGIIIDNRFTTAAQQIYFSSPNNAFQASQLNLGL